jgi:DNA-binding IclR family transcriptional regulator
MTNLTRLSAIATRPHATRNVAAMAAGDGPRPGWTFVTNHFLVLLCIAEDPGIRMADVAARVGVTERSVQGMVRDLVETGYLQKTRVGRRNHYEIDAAMPLRHLETAHRHLGELLALLKHTV